MFMMSVSWSDEAEVIIYRSFQDFKEFHVSQNQQCQKQVLIKSLSLVVHNISTGKSVNVFSFFFFLLLLFPNRGS